MDNCVINKLITFSCVIGNECGLRYTPSEFVNDASFSHRWLIVGMQSSRAIQSRDIVRVTRKSYIIASHSIVFIDSLRPTTAIALLNSPQLNSSAAHTAKTNRFKIALHSRAESLSLESLSRGALLIAWTDLLFRSIASFSFHRTLSGALLKLNHVREEIKWKPMFHHSQTGIFMETVHDSTMIWSVSESTANRDFQRQFSVHQIIMSTSCANCTTVSFSIWFVALFARSGTFARSGCV